MKELLYEAQQFFPPKCMDCPMLVGFIEDGLISPTEVSRAEVLEALGSLANSVNFEACPGTQYGDSVEENITICAQ